MVIKLRYGFAFLHKFCNFALQCYNINIPLHYDGLDVLPVVDFLRLLYQDDIF